MGQGAMGSVQERRYCEIQGRLDDAYAVDSAIAHNATVVCAINQVLEMDDRPIYKVLGRNSMCKTGSRTAKAALWLDVFSNRTLPIWRICRDTRS